MSEARRPAMCLKLNEKEKKMLNELSDYWEMSKSEVLRYLLRRAYDENNGA